MSIWHVLLVVLVVVLIFGAGRLPKAMGDLATGIKNFRRNLGDKPADPAPVEPPAATTVQSAVTTEPPKDKVGQG